MRNRIAWGTVRRVLSALTLSLLWVASAALAQLPLPQEQLLLLVAGPSGDRIDPREKAVVAHLNGLRGNYNFSQLQMGTMHYDRPREATLLKNPLGFNPQKGVTVGLVQLSEQGLPVRTLYKMENVTQASLLAAQNDLLSRWSTYTGQPLPAALRPAGTPGGPGSNSAPVTPPPVASNPVPPTRPNTPSTSQPWISNVTPREVYSFEGIQAVVYEIDDMAHGLWSNVMNAPLRSDGNDVKLREQTKALADATEALRRAHDAGVIYPQQELGQVARIGRAWQQAEPQYFLPVPFRGSVPHLLELILRVEEIGVQGVRTPATAPTTPPAQPPQNQP